MAHKFKQGDHVFFKGAPEAPNTRGFYYVDSVGKDGNIYRILDSNKDFTDVNEDEIDHIIYSVFVNVHHKTPVIVPKFDTALYNHFLNSKHYTLTGEGTIVWCLTEEVKILRELDLGETTPDDEQATD